MADINENTRIAIKAGSVFGACMIVFAVGAWYGDLRNDRKDAAEDKVMQTEAIKAGHEAQSKIDDRQDAAIAQLQSTVSSMNTTLQLIKQAQDTQLPQLIRQSTYTTEIMRDLEVALAEGGIKRKEHGP